MKFDPSKPVQTRDGRAARIVATDRKSNHYPIVAFVESGDEEYCHTYTTDGRYHFVGEESPSDLVNLPE